MRVAFRSDSWASVALPLILGTMLLAASGDSPRTRDAAAGDTTGSTPVAPAPPDAASVGKPELRLREGASLTDEAGEFHDAGDRLVFQSQQRKTVFTVLENLSLERVATVLGENTGPRLWSVSGTVTEFRGANYLLITRAVLRAKKGTYAPVSTPAVP